MTNRSAAYAAACNESVKVTIAPQTIGLKLPEKWDGPAALPLSLGVTVLAVLFAGFWGVSAIMLLSNM